MPAGTVTEALRELAPSAGMAEAAHLARFHEIAELLLGRTMLYVAGQPHRFTELELYWTSPEHPDPFTHGDPIQQQLGVWYFHRSGQRYRGGTYKGLDIAFGRGAALGSSAAFGGILIRGVERASDPPALIDGPCMVVDHLLALTASPAIEDLVGRFDGTIESADRRSPLHVELDAGASRTRPVYATPRIGLTLKKGSTEARRRYLARPYRFLSEPARIRKGKPHLVIALHQQGRSPAEIATLTGTRRAVLEGYLAAYEAGRGGGSAGPSSNGDGDLSTEQLCRLLGACVAAAST